MNARQESRYIGGVSPSLPTATKSAVALPPSSGALIKTCAPTVTAERSVGWKATIGAVGGTRTFFLPPAWVRVIRLAPPCSDADWTSPLVIVELTLVSEPLDEAASTVPLVMLLATLLPPGMFVSGSVSQP